MKISKQKLAEMIIKETKAIVDEGYRDYDPEDKFTDSRTKSYGYSSHRGRLGDETDFDGPIPSRGHSGGYSSHTGRLGDEQHDGSYEIPKWKVPSNLSAKQKKDFDIAMQIIQNAYDMYGGGRAVIKALNDAVRYGLDADAAQMANRAYAEQMMESLEANLTKEKLVKIITEELSQLLKESDMGQTDLMADVDPENLSAEDELGVADSAPPRSAKERLLAMLLAAEDIERLRAEFADDEEMQKELDKVEANPFYNPQGAYKSPRMSEGFIHHVVNDKPLTESVYRVGSDSYFELIREVRVQYKKGIYKPLNEEEQEMLDSDLGEWAEFEGESVPLDFPMYEETLDEKRKRKKKKKKDPPIGKPMKNTGGGKKYKVFVRSPSGRVKKISYGDSKGGLKGNWNSAEARKSFASRHNCAEKKDRTKAGYWACRAHKDFGTNVPGRFW